jgi:hypothetical protein
VDAVASDEENSRQLQLHHRLREAAELLVEAPAPVVDAAEGEADEDGADRRATT